MDDKSDDQLHANAWWGELISQYEQTGKVNKTDLLEVLNLKTFIPPDATELISAAITENIFNKRPNKYGKYESIQLGSRVEFYAREYQKSPEKLKIGYTPREQAKEKVAQQYRVTERTIENLLSKYRQEIAQFIRVADNNNLSPPDDAEN